MAAIRFHYDVGEDFYRLWLDRRLTYSCAYFERPDDPDADLDAAQEAKLDLICRKLDLQPGQRLLDIGCGWGSLISYAAERYGVDVGRITSAPDPREAHVLGQRIGPPAAPRLPGPSACRRERGKIIVAADSDRLAPTPRSVFVISGTVRRCSLSGAGRLLTRLVPDRLGVLAVTPPPRLTRVVGPSVQGDFGSLVRGRVAGADDDDIAIASLSHRSLASTVISAVSSDAELAVRGALLPVPNGPIEDGDRAFRVINVGAAPRA